jgi:hypothetical protein
MYVIFDDLQSVKLNYHQILNTKHVRKESMNTTCESFKTQISARKSRV